MEISTERFADATGGVLALDGALSEAFSRPELREAHLAFAAALIEAKRAYAPLAAEIARRSTPTSDGFARAEGFPSAERFIAAGIGGTIAEARMLIEAGQALDDAPDPADDEQPDGGGEGGEDAPEDGPDGGPEDGPDDDPDDPPAPKPKPHVPLSPTGRALRDGLITPEAAALIRSTLRALDGETRELEERLVGKAKRNTLVDLRRACERARAHHDAARAAERARRQRASRRLFMSEEADGMIRLTAWLDPGSAAPVKAFIDAFTTDAFRRRRDLDLPDDRTAAQIRLDGLVALAEHGLACTEVPTGARTTVVVHLGLDQLRSGLGLGECDSTGGQLTPGDVRRRCADAELIPAVLGGASLPLDLGRAERLCTRAQKLALAVRDRGCAWCGAPAAWCEAHHIVHWADGGATDLCNAVLLCRSCHLRIHDTGWDVTIRDDRVWFVPPADVDPERKPRPAARHRVEARDDYGSRGDPPPDEPGALF